MKKLFIKKSLTAKLAAILLFFVVDVNTLIAKEIYSKLFEELETKVWLSKDSDLLLLEKETVKEFQKHPKSPFIHYLLSHLYMRLFIFQNTNNTETESLNYLQKSLELAQQAILLSPESETGYIAVADILDIMGESEKSKLILKQINDQAIDKTWRTDFLLTRLSAKEQLPAEILAKMMNVIDDPSSNRDIIVPFVISVLDISYTSSLAIKEAEKWHNKFPHSTFAMYIASKYIELNEPKKAEMIYKDIIKKYPNLVEAQINLAIVAYSSNKDYKSAIRILEKLNQLPSLSRANKTLVEIHLATALLTFTRDSLRAQNLFLKSLVNAENNQEFLVNFAINQYNQIGKFKELVSFLTVLAEEIPGTASLHALLGEIKFHKLKNATSAIISYDNAIALDPTNSEHYDSVGLIYYSQGEYAKALIYFNNALLLNPNDPTANYNKACMLALLGRRDESLAFLKRALQLNPLLLQTAMFDTDLNNIREMKLFKNLIYRKELSQN